MPSNFNPADAQALAVLAPDALVGDRGKGLDDNDDNDRSDDSGGSDDEGDYDPEQVAAVEAELAAETDPVKRENLALILHEVNEQRTMVVYGAGKRNDHEEAQNQWEGYVDEDGVYHPPTNTGVPQVPAKDANGNYLPLNPDGSVPMMDCPNFHMQAAAKAGQKRRPGRGEGTYDPCSTEGNSGGGGDSLNKRIVYGTWTAYEDGCVFTPEQHPHLPSYNDSKRYWLYLAKGKKDMTCPVWLTKAITLENTEDHARETTKLVIDMSHNPGNDGHTELVKTWMTAGIPLDKVDKIIKITPYYASGGSKIQGWELEGPSEYFAIGHIENNNGMKTYEVAVWQKDEDWFESDESGWNELSVEAKKALKGEGENQNPDEPFAVCTRTGLVALPEHHFLGGFRLWRRIKEDKSDSESDHDEEDYTSETDVIKPTPTPLLMIENGPLRKPPGKKYRDARPEADDDGWETDESSLSGDSDSSCLSDDDDDDDDDHDDDDDDDNDDRDDDDEELQAAKAEVNALEEAVKHAAARLQSATTRAEQAQARLGALRKRKRE